MEDLERIRDYAVYILNESVKDWPKMPDIGSSAIAILGHLGGYIECPKWNVVKPEGVIGSGSINDQSEFNNPK